MLIGSIYCSNLGEWCTMVFLSRCEVVAAITLPQSLVVVVAIRRFHDIYCNIAYNKELSVLVPSRTYQLFLLHSSRLEFGQRGPGQCSSRLLVHSKGIKNQNCFNSCNFRFPSSSRLSLVLSNDRSELMQARAIVFLYSVVAWTYHQVSALSIVYLSIVKMKY